MKARETRYQILPGSSEMPGGEAIFKVLVPPLVTGISLGGGVIMVGSVVALRSFRACAAREA